MIRTSSSTKNKARLRPRPDAAKSSYRCPACGETVDNRDLDAVRFHHHHVLHPRLDLYVTLPAFVPRIAPEARGNQNGHD
jgi:hypothetical protein